MLEIEHTMLTGLLSTNFIGALEGFGDGRRARLTQEQVRYVGRTLNIVWLRGFAHRIAIDFEGFTSGLPKFLQRNVVSTITGRSTSLIAETAQLKTFLTVGIRRPQMTWVVVVALHRNDCGTHLEARGPARATV